MTMQVTLSPNLSLILKNIPTTKVYLDWDNGYGRFYGEKTIELSNYSLDYYVEAFGSCVEVLKLTHDSQAEFKSCVKVSVSNVVLWNSEAEQISLDYEQSQLLAKEIKSKMILI